MLPVRIYLHDLLASYFVDDTNVAGASAVLPGASILDGAVRAWESPVTVGVVAGVVHAGGPVVADGVLAATTNAVLDYLSAIVNGREFALGKRAVLDHWLHGLDVVILTIFGSILLNHL